MNIEEIKEQVEQAMEDKQEFADLCFHLVPQLIQKIEQLEKDKTMYANIIKADVNFNERDSDNPFFKGYKPTMYFNTNE